MVFGAAPLWAAPAAGSHVLWEIGKADGDDRELALAPAGYEGYKQDAVFTVGAGDARKDWPYVLPGPDDGWAGGKAHTASIVFAVDPAGAAGGCRLTLRFVDGHSAFPPLLKISVNGRSWTRTTPQGAGDASLEGRPEAGHKFEITVDFPSSLLRRGANIIQIANVEGAWAVWDAVTLTAPSGVTVGPPPVVTTLVAAAWTPDVLVRGAGGALDRNLSLATLNTGPRADSRFESRLVAGSGRRRSAWAGADRSSFSGSRSRRY